MDPIIVQEFSKGTKLVENAYLGFVSAHAICEDGKLRKTSYIHKQANSAWSIDATMKIKGKRVKGCLSIVSESDLSTDSENFIQFKQFKGVNNV